MATEADAPDGTTWRVGRVWVERSRPRWRGPRDTPDLDLPDLGGGDDLGIIGVVLAVVAAVVVLVFIVAFGVPLLLLGVEVLVALVLVAVGVVARLLSVRPWLVRATGADGAVVERRAHGWRASREAVDELAGQARAGQLRANAPSPTTPSPSPAPTPLGEEPAEDRAGRAWIALVLGLVWLGGITSVLALPLALGVLRRPGRSRSTTALCWLAIAVALAGLVLTLLLVAGLVSEARRGAALA